MEAASRSVPEPLRDLPAEAPDRGTGATSAQRDPEQTSLNFVDPELFAPVASGPGPAAPAAPGTPDSPAPAASSAARATPAVTAAPELTLEDPVVDELLSTPLAPAPVATPSLAAAAPLQLSGDSPRPATDKSAAGEGAAAKAGSADKAARSSRVPIARTATLSATATRTIAAKLAAAGKGTTATPGDPAVQPAAAGEQGAAKSGAARLDAPSFANWASARASAGTVAKPATAVPSRSTPTVPSKPVAAGPTKPATVAPVVPVLSAAPVLSPAATVDVAGAPIAAAGAPAPAAPMDRDFIARNQVVERYLCGRLPLRGAADFERFCHEHPELLDEIGLPARVNAGLRLLEASGKPEPWQEEPRPIWQKPQVTLGLAAAAVLLAVGLSVAISASVTRTHQIESLKKQVAERALDPAVSTREIRLLPSRTGASNTPAITIGGNSAGAELAVLKIDESRSPYHAYRVTIDRIDQGRVGVISNLGKDSNGHLRIALNSSALGPGNYQFTIEGMDWRGDPTPDSWVTVGVQ
ncbi:MAG: hypothetical protein JSR67_09130 [Proteobacteria bacterium]|nr:hypothetical protein [Pseudomonadota bacterium]